MHRLAVGAGCLAAGFDGGWATAGTWLDVPGLGCVLTRSVVASRR